MKTYKAKSGAWFGNDKAQRYGERLEQLSTNGRITPEEIVADAKRITSPLHDAFEWDNSEASRKYRLNQARMLLGYIEVEIRISASESKNYRAYLGVKQDKGVNKMFIDVENVMKSDILRGKYLMQALKEAENWQHRYDEYAELGMIFSAIQKTKKTISKKIKVRV